MTTPNIRPKLDVRFHKDPRSRNFATSAIVPTTARFKRVWTTRKEPLDQGQDGHCVGFSSAGLLAAKPQAYTVDNSTGDKIFFAAQSIDRAEGRNYDDGATVLAGMKACQNAQFFSKYGWCFGVDDVINWIVRKGPVILGINWHEDMFNPSPEGLLSVTGAVAGGHAILANGYWPHHPEFDDVVVLTNSWGRNWGRNGRAYLPMEGLQTLLSEEGEAAAPTELPVHPI